MEGKKEVAIEPSDMLEYGKKLRKLPAVRVGRVCIGCFESRILKKLVEKTGAVREENWIDNRLYTFSMKGEIISIRKFDWGAPAAVHNLELLIAAGARYFIVFGGAGAIQEDLKPGDLVIATRAIRDEGTSYHYLPPSRFVDASAMVIEALKEACRVSNADYREGTVWTTDAIFRERRDVLERYKSWGVLACEMEAAALYAVSKFRGVEAGVLLYISDSIAGDKWTPFFVDETVLRSIDVGVDITIRTAGILLDKITR
ncbi:MAG: nucleoside phosphorylase [Candidatus Baldrarchaeia archaeon]